MTFTPNDTANYNTLTQNVSITVNKADPVVTWPTGLEVGPWQSSTSKVFSANATSNVPGTFEWDNPSAITASGTYTMRFTPTATANYNTMTQNVTVTFKANINQVISGGVSLEMVWIPAGNFIAGSSQTNEANRVTLTSGYYMGKYEVTQEQWQAVMAGNANGISATPSSFNTNPASGELQAKRPVESISWYDAIVFCNRLSTMHSLTPAYSINGSTDPATWGQAQVWSVDAWNAVTIVEGSTGYRLPTEAQWEYACRAGTTTTYNLGAAWNNDYGWIRANSDNMTHEVGEKSPNAWGLYDMHGNIVEKCWDWYGTTYPTGTSNPTGAASGDGRVSRGGSWNGLDTYVTSAYRIQQTMYSRAGNSTDGLRLVRP
jgi:formylglycine-generating enzyme required for sulfatase activity